MRRESPEHIKEEYGDNSQRWTIPNDADLFYNILDQEPEYTDLIDIKGLNQGGTYFADFILEHDETIQFDDKVYVPRSALSDADEKVSDLQNKSQSNTFRGQLLLGTGITLFGINEFLNGRWSTGIGTSSIGAGLLGHHFTDKIESYTSAKTLYEAWADYTKFDGGEDVVFKQFEEIRSEMATENHKLFEK